MRRLCAELTGLLIVTAVVGTGFHLSRSDAKRKIPFVGRYYDPAELEAGGGPAQPAPDGGSSALPSSGSPSPRAVAPPGVPDRDPAAGETENAADAPGPEPLAAESPDGPPGPDEISIEDAYAEIEAGGVVLVDARRTRFYEQGHIPGAHLLSLWEGDFEDRLMAFINTEDPGAPVLCYCMSENCTDSHQVARRLRAAGFENVRVIRGGFPEWAKKGYPVEKGSEEGES